MSSLRAYVALEEALAKALRQDFVRRNKDTLTRITAAVSVQDYARAYDLISNLSFKDTVNETSDKLTDMGVRAVLLGASRLSPVRKTRFAGKAVPRLVHRSVGVLKQYLTESAATFLRDRLHAVVADHENARKELAKADITAEDPVRLTKLYETSKDVADELYRAMTTGTKMATDVGANMVTSRLVSYGFLSQAIENKVTQYQYTAVLDQRVCGICAHLDGMIFSVGYGYKALDELLNIDDPEALASVHPFPDSSKAGVAEFENMSTAELEASGYAVPPQHPNCRCQLVPVESVPDEEVVSGENMTTEDDNYSVFSDEDQPSVDIRDATFDMDNMDLSDVDPTLFDALSTLDPVDYEDALLWSVPDAAPEGTQEPSSEIPEGMLHPSVVNKPAPPDAVETALKAIRVARGVLGRK